MRESKDIKGRLQYPRRQGIDRKKNRDGNKRKRTGRFNKEKHVGKGK